MDAEVRDLRIETKVIRVIGVAMHPAAMSQPIMPLVARDRRTPPLKTLRARFARSRGNEALTQQLARALWDAAALLDATDKEQARNLRTEARRTLEAHLKRKPKATSAVVEMAAVSSSWLGDMQAAAGYYERLVSQQEIAGEPKAWLSWHRLRSGELAKARMALETVEPKDAGAKTLYMMGWTEFLAGDETRAVELLVSSFLRWPEGKTRELVLSETISMFVHAQSAVVDVQRFAQAAKLDEHLLLERFANKCAELGRYDIALDALALTLRDEQPVQDLARALYLQSEHSYRLLRVSDAATQAIAAFGTCDASCPDELRAKLSKRLLDLGLRFHTMFAASFDSQYFDAASALYAAYPQGQSPENERVEKFKLDLDDFRDNADRLGSDHTEEVIGFTVQSRIHDATLCQEAALRRGEASGELRLSLEIDDQGQVVGGSAEPGGGLDGIAAVSACLTDQAKDWKFPSRAVPGTTVLLVPFRFVVQDDPNWR